MKELLAITAANSSKEDIVKMIESACAKYRQDPSDRNFHFIGMVAGLIIMRLRMKNDGSFEDVSDVIDDMNKLEKMYDFFNPGRQ